MFIDKLLADNNNNYYNFYGACIIMYVHSYW